MTVKHYFVILFLIGSFGLLFWKYQFGHFESRAPIGSFNYSQGNGTNESAGHNCESECQRFKSFLASNWPEKKPRAAIYVLTHSLTNVIKLVQNVEITLLYTVKYPYIIFHEKDFLNSILEIRRQNLPHSRIFYQKVDFSHLPDHITIHEYNHTIGQHCSDKPIGYRHMCYFHSKLVYNHPIMDQLEYSLRLDDDSQFLQPIRYDLFKFMRDSDLHYGYVATSTDQSDCVYGLWKTVENFIAENQINSTFFPTWKEPNIFYNNFEVSKMSIWKSKEYRGYIDYIDQSKGIFLRRWGDAPIKTLALSVFTPRSKIHQFRDIRYRHQSLIT